MNILKETTPITSCEAGTLIPMGLDARQYDLAKDLGFLSRRRTNKLQVGVVHRVWNESTIQDDPFDVVWQKWLEIKGMWWIGTDSCTIPIIEMDMEQSSLRMSCYLLLFQSVSYSSIELYRYELLRGTRCCFFPFFPKRATCRDAPVDRNDSRDATKLGGYILHNMYHRAYQSMSFQKNTM